MKNRLAARLLSLLPKDLFQFDFADDVDISRSVDESTVTPTAAAAAASSAGMIKDVEERTGGMKVELEVGSFWLYIEGHVEGHVEDTTRF